MKNKKPNANSFLISICMLLILNGCALFDKAMKPDPSEFTTVVFDIPFEETWQAIQKVTRSEALPIHILDEKLGVIETQRVLIFNKKRLYRQYISLYVEVKRLSENFTSVGVSFYISRYNPVTHEWRRISGTRRQKRFLDKVRVALETG